MTKARDTANLVATGVPNSLITLDAAEIPNISTDKLTSGTLANARVADLPTSKITSGTFADARISEGSVTQHVAATDLTGVNADITALALREATNESSAAFNLPNKFIETFTDDTNLGTQTTVDRTSGYINTLTTATDYDQILSTTRANIIRATGGWTNAITNDSIQRPSGSGGDYPSYYVNWIYDLATDWKIKLFIVTTSTGANTTENYAVWNCLITTDTSATVGADNAGASSDGTYFRAEDTSSDAAQGMYRITTAAQWGDDYLTAAYAATIGSDSASPNNMDGAAGHQTIDCSSGSTPWISNYYVTQAGAYGTLIEYDQDANTISIRQPTNSAWSSFGAQKTTFSNVPATGRFICVPGSGGMSTAHSWSTTMASIADADKGYVQVNTTNATGTLIQSANAVASPNKTKVGGTMLYKDNAGTATLGTDLKIYFTANGGSNWTEAASYNAITPVYSTGIKQVRLGETTVTGGTDVRYKAVWANQAAGSKETQLHGIGINY